MNANVREKNVFDIERFCVPLIVNLSNPFKVYLCPRGKALEYLKTVNISSRVLVHVDEETRGPAGAWGPEIKAENKDAPQIPGLLGTPSLLLACIQLLFHCPEFCNGLFSWEFDEKSHGPPDLSLPYQLQILFTRLLTSSEPVIVSANIQKCVEFDHGHSCWAKSISGPHFWWRLTDSLRKAHFSVDFFKTFTGEIQQRKVFSSLSKTTSDERIFMFDLEIQTNSEDVVSLDQGLKKLLSPRFKPHEQVEEGGFSDVHTQSKITRLPEILLIHLNRIVIDWDTDPPKITKSTHHVKTPKELDILGQSYELYGKMVCHVGKDQYSAQIRMKSGEWYSIFDEIVRKMSRDGAEVPPSKGDFVEFVLYRSRNLKHVERIEPPPLRSEHSSEANAEIVE